MNLRLPIDVYSPDQLSLCIQELRGFLGKRRDATARARIAGEKVSSPALSTPLLALLDLDNISGDKSQAIEELIAALETARLEAPTVHLTFATMPNLKFIEQLTTWFRNEVHPQALLVVTMSREIGGGMVVRAGSSVYDWSFKSQLLRNKDRISEIFSRV